MTSYAAFGTLIKIGDGGSPTETFTTIAQINAISGLGVSLDTEEVTHHSSTGRYKEFVGTLLEMKEITLELNFDPAHATHSYTAGLINDLVDRTLRNFQLVFPDSGNTTWAFAAFVTDVDIGAPHEGKLAGSITLRPSGQPTLA